MLQARSYLRIRPSATAAAFPGPWLLVVAVLCGAATATSAVAAPKQISCDGLLTPGDIDYLCGINAVLATPEAERDHLGLASHSCSRRFSSNQQLLNMGLFLEPSEQQAAQNFARVPESVDGQVTEVQGVGQQARRYIATITKGGARVVRIEFLRGRISGFISTLESSPMCRNPSLAALSKVILRRLPEVQEQAPSEPKEPELVPSIASTTPERVYKLAGLTCGAIATDKDVAAACGAAPAKSFKPQADVRVPLGSSCLISFAADGIIGPSVQLENFASVAAAKTFFDRPYRAGFGLTKIRQLTGIGNQAHIGTTQGPEFADERQLMARSGNVVVLISAHPLAGLPLMCSEDGLVDLAKRIVARLK